MVRQRSKHYTASNCSIQFLNGVLCGQMLQSVLEFNFTTMRAMSYWSDYHPWICTVNIEEPAVGFTMSSLLALPWVGLPSFLFATAMLDSKCFNTSLLEVMICSKSNTSLFAIWPTVHCKWSYIVGGLQWIKSQSGLLLGIILDMRIYGNSIYTVQLKSPAALASYESFVLIFFAIHKHMVPTQWGNTCWQKLTSRSYTI